MRNPLAVLRPRRRGPELRLPEPRTGWAGRLDEQGLEADGEHHVPEVSVRGIDSRCDRPPDDATVHLSARDGGPCPDTVPALLTLTRPADFRVRHLVFDVRRLDAVLGERGGRALLERLVAAPDDRVTNAVFRAAVARDAAEARDAAAPTSAACRGDLDCDVRVVAEGDAVAGRCRVDLGPARLTLVPLLTRSERLVRRLAEARAHPRDRAVRRCLEYALGMELTTVPLSALVSAHPCPSIGGDPRR